MIQRKILHLKKKKSSVSEWNSKPTNDNEITNMNSSIVHNTYAQLICREDKKSKHSANIANNELKDFSQLRRYRKGETTYDNPPTEPNFRKKNFDVPKDLVKKIWMVQKEKIYRK